jgi:hypothetical protein
MPTPATRYVQESMTEGTLFVAFALSEKTHIPPNYVVKGGTSHRKPPEVRICRLRNQLAVGTGSVTKRLLSSTASKAHGSAS